MFFYNLIWYAFLGILAFVILLIGKVLYSFVYMPYKIRKHFSQYGSKVVMGKSFVPLAGDFKAINKDYVSKGKYIGDYMLDNYREAKQEGSASYTLFHVGESV